MKEINLTFIQQRKNKLDKTDRKYIYNITRFLFQIIVVFLNFLFTVFTALVVFWFVFPQREDKFLQIYEWTTHFKYTKLPQKQIFITQNPKDAHFFSLKHKVYTDLIFWSMHFICYFFINTIKEHAKLFQHILSNIHELSPSPFHDITTSSLFPQLFKTNWCSCSCERCCDL